MMRPKFNRISLMLLVLSMLSTTLFSQSQKELHYMLGDNLKNAQLVEYLKDGKDPNFIVNKAPAIFCSSFAIADKNLRTLFEHGVDPNQKNWYSINVIQDIVRGFLFYHRRGYQYPERFINALKAACEFGADINDISGIVELIPDNGAGMPYGKRNFLSELLAVNNNDIMKAVIDCGLNIAALEKVYEPGNFFIDELIKNDKKVLLNYLFEKNDPTILKYMPSILEMKDFELAIKMIEKGADVNRLENETKLPPLIFAISANNTELINLLITKGASVNQKGERGYTPVHHASRIGRVEVLKIFLENEGDVNQETEDGYNSLFLAAGMDSNIETFKLIHENGADINKLSEKGSTILMQAVYAWSDDEIMQYILNNGIDINKKNNDGETALHFACKYGYPTAFEFLLKNGAEINAVSNNGLTPLHYYCMGSKKVNPKTEVIKILLDNGADMNAKDNRGNTPRRIAQNSGNQHIAKFLKSLGAEK